MSKPLFRVAAALVTTLSCHALRPSDTFANVKVCRSMEQRYEQIERGEFGELHAWLRENIYSLGRKLTPAETVARVVGGPIDAQPYLAYLRGKFELFANA